MKVIFVNIMLVVLSLVLFAQGNYSFGPSIRVNDDPPGTHDRACSQRSSACRGDTVFLTWDDSRFGHFCVFFSKSTDSGTTWGSNMVISQNIAGYDCGLPHMCLDASGNIFITYVCRDSNNSTDIYLVRSINGGSSFTTPVIVNDSVTPDQWYPSIVVDSSGQVVYVAWQDWRNYSQYETDIYFARSTDSGTSFLPAIRVNDDSTMASQWYPVVDCDHSGQNVYVAWQDPRDTLHYWDIYFSRSTDFGQTFEPNYPMNDTATTDGTAQSYPSIYYKNGIVYAAWHDGRDGYSVYAAKSLDNGVSFGPNVRVADNPNADGYDASITVDDSAKVYIVWHDFRNFDPYGWEIYFSYSTDSGQTFKPNILVNDHQGNWDAIDDNPSICVNDSGIIFVAWDSDRNDHQWGFEDIYCAAGYYVGIQEFYDFELSTNVLRCFPNPFSKFLIININSGQNANDLELKIYDVAGRVIRHFNRLTNPKFNQVTWFADDQQGRDIPAGVYIVELVNNGKCYSKKIIKTGGMK